MFTSVKVFPRRGRVNAVFLGLAFGFILLSLWMQNTWASENVIIIKGSDTIGSELGPALAKAYTATNTGVKIQWEGLGSSTAIPGLFDGSAQIGATSRPVNASEISEATEKGVVLKEYILGLDGVAVIAHPSNTVNKLDLDQLSGLFTGKISNWREVGGANVPVNLLSRPVYSGTHSLFKEKVLRKGNKKGAEEFAPSTIFIEHSEELIQSVASNEGAIGYIGMPYVRAGVVALRIKGSNGTFQVPNSQTVRDGTYPICRSLYLYTLGEPQGEVRRFLTFILAGDGRKLVSSNGFLPADVPMTIQRSVTTTSDISPPQLHRVYFNTGQSTLTPETYRALGAATAPTRRRSHRVFLYGHSDVLGAPETNRRLAWLRAVAVAKVLVQFGTPPESIVIRVKGAQAPIATNTTPQGRRENRRVDVEMVPMSSAMP